MSDKPKVVSLSAYQPSEKAPEELIDLLESALKAAKSGKLVSLILDYQEDTGTEVNVEGQFLWRSDGRLTTLHSDCHLLAHRVLEALLNHE